MKHLIPTLSILATVATAAPPQADELFCYTIGPYAAPGHVPHDTPTVLGMTTWPYQVEATWGLNQDFDNNFDFALRVRYLYWPVPPGTAEVGTQQVVFPEGYTTADRIDIVSGGNSIGFDPTLEPFAGVDRLSMRFNLADVVNDEYLFVVLPCEGDLNFDTHRNIPDLICCINDWGTPYGIPDLIAVINNFGDDC